MIQHLHDGNFLPDLVAHLPREDFALVHELDGNMAIGRRVNCLLDSANAQQQAGQRLRNPAFALTFPMRLRQVSRQADICRRAPSVQPDRELRLARPS